MQTVLVTGGAGYIGSHMVKMLRGCGYEPIVLDDLSNGHADAVRYGELVEGDIADRVLLDSLFENYKPQLVMHFASLILVGESMQYPEKYQEFNVERSKVLIETAAKFGVPFIFSSTAATFGNPLYTPIDEQHVQAPINPYGDTKLQCERFLGETYEEAKLTYGVLRYFNAAGADPDGELGERHDPETHLIPLVLQAACGMRDSIAIYGDDYDTDDGTCVRDYIHVNDLCDAHVKLFEYMKNGGEEHHFNLGIGHGYSVKEVIDVASKVVGRDIPKVIDVRREGDPAVLIANGDKARTLLGWEPVMSDLETIITHAWAFMQSQQNIG